VVTLDLVMPNLDGIGVLRALPAGQGPRVVVVSMSDAASELGIEALQHGAVDLVHKPTALATDRLFELGEELVGKVRIAAAAQPRPLPAPPPAEARPRAPAQPAAGTELLVIGASTGGPQALAHLLAALPGDFPLPIALVLHIPAEYTGPFAARLHAGSELEVVEAFDGVPLRAGRVVVARGGLHLKIDRVDGGFIGRLDAQPVTTPHRPAVDVLFASAAAAAGKGALAVVLTGMGDDGLAGARAVRAAGGRVLTEAESSCVVYGMPRTVDEAGLSNGSAPIVEMAALVVRSL